MVNEARSCLCFKATIPTPGFCQIVIIVPAAFVSRLYYEAALDQQGTISTVGFHTGSTPVAYIQQNFKSILVEHLKEFLFNFFVANFLYRKIYEKKIPLAGDPRLVNIYLEPDADAEFHFELTLAQPINVATWKKATFKAPARKNYKDLDKQVEQFLREELTSAKEHTQEQVAPEDWVGFDIFPLSRTQERILSTHQESLWVKLGAADSDCAFQHDFVGRKVGDVFHSASPCFQEYFSEVLETHYPFGIEITDIVPHGFFSLECFKKHFKLTTAQELHNKLIEVFSFRQDMSQRRLTVEEALKALLKKHELEAPEHLILRQQEAVLTTLRNNPDYPVYKAQSDFHERVRMLSEKQAKEMILIDQIAFRENINVTPKDVRYYLNLVKRPRTKEFIYFSLLILKRRGRDMPLPAELLRQSCLREKTLNHVIAHLAR